MDRHRACFGMLIRYQVVRFSTAFYILTFLFLASSTVPPSRAEDLRFAPLVQFKVVSVLAPVVGSVGSLSTTFGEKEIQMRLTNVAAAGADKTQELITKVDKSDLSLISSVVYDVV